MDNHQLPLVLVARFLKANHYNDTLQAFLKEAKLTEKTAGTNPGDWTLENLLQEKIQFDTSLNLEKKENEANQAWTRPSPCVPVEPELETNTNVLSIKGSPDGTLLAITAANNSCSLISSQPPYPPLQDKQFHADSPILSTSFLADQHLAATTMSGKLLVFDTHTGVIISERRDHGKWAVSVATWQGQEPGAVRLFATAGWDQKVHLYSTSSLSAETVLEQPFHTIDLQSNPESLVFASHPDNGQLYLILSRRDSSFLYYFRITVDDFPSEDQPPRRSVRVSAAGRQNLAPHSNAWVAFTPSALAMHPSDPSLLAIATSHLPHLKVIIVRLLFPDNSLRPSTTQDPESQTPAAVARANLALQDREDAAITLQISTQAPQTQYSTPQICWRPDGSGVWVNSDDGVVRGVEIKTGKVTVLLRAHEAGSKVRTLWAGFLKDHDTAQHREVVISGGFDRRIFIWEVPK